MNNIYSKILKAALLRVLNGNVCTIDKSCYCPAHRSVCYDPCEGCPKTVGMVGGLQLYPNDNSYCIDLETGKDACLFGPCCRLDEKDAKFFAAGEPYIDTCNTHFDGDRRRWFINVRSSKTKKLYRILFSKYCLTKRFCDDDE